MTAIMRPLIWTAPEPFSVDVPLIVGALTMRSNVIQLHLTPGPEDHCQVVQVVIDGRDLIDLIRVLETPLALAEDNPHLAGAYSGMALEKWRKGPAPAFDGWSPILDCECGTPDCWPFLTRINAGKNTITWSDFKQPFRPRWSYTGLGPFVFDRAQYQVELQKLGCVLDPDRV